MPIEIACSCGQTYHVKSELAGKRVRCPKCGGAISVPADTDSGGFSAISTEESDPFGFDSPLENAPNLPGLGRKCPNCMSPLEPHAVFCVMCGFNLQTGQQVKTVRDATAGTYHPSIAQIRAAFAFVGATILIIGLIIVGVAAGSEGKGTAVVPGILLSALGVAGCVAAAMAVSEIRIERTPQGAAEIIQSRGLGPLRFVRRYEARDFDGVYFVQVAGKGGDHTLLLCIMMGLMCVGFIPGLVWWMILLRGKDANVAYRVELRKEGRKPVVLLRGGEDAKPDANAIARLIENATDLPREQELGLVNTGNLSF